MLSFQIAARDLSAESLTLRPTDISARTHPREDFNGDKCALIKVSLPVEGCKFEGAVGECAFDVNEYWVYMPSGAKRLRVKCPGFETLDVVFADCSDISSLIAQDTYLLKIGGYEGISDNSTKETGFNYLVISISPNDISGLFVKIDDELQSVDDGEVTARLKYGEHSYSVEANGYESVKGNALVKQGSSTKVKVEMKSVVATLNLRSSDQDVEIKINGKVKGYGEWIGELAPGNYLIEVSKDGYHSYTENIELSKMDQKSITIPVLKPLTGSIAVEYKPTGALISLDGVNVGETPQVLENVAVGYHKLTVSKDGYKEIVEGNVLVKDGEETYLKGALEEEDQPAENVPTFSVDVDAAFPGGNVEMRRQLSELINIPPDTPEGRYLIPFELTIDETGNITDINLLESDPNLKSIEEECVRVLKQLPPFYPAIKDGMPVKSQFPIKLPVTVMDVTHNQDITQASFPGGDMAMGKYLSEHLVIPDGTAPGIYTIPFDLYLDEKGHVYEVKSLEKNIDLWQLEKECIRVLQEMPDFIPGTRNGQPIKSIFSVTIPVRVIASEDEQTSADVQYNPPTFPGGYEKLSNKISKLLKIPNTVTPGQYNIPMELTINQKGKVVDVKVTQPKHYLLDLENECIRVMKLLPNFNPATQEGKPIQSTLPLDLPINITK